MNNKIQLLHNPKCSKCRATMELLTKNGADIEVIEYLKTPPTSSQLNDIIKLLGVNPRDLMRQHEAPYQEQNLGNPNLSHQQLIDAMIAYPILIERPIVINGKKATIGRPPTKVLDIL